jgi:hypothetical protein
MAKVRFTESIGDCAAVSTAGLACRSDNHVYK